MTFILVMIASLAAVGLAPGLGSTGGHSGVEIDDDEVTAATEEPDVGIPSFDTPESTIDTTLAHEALITTDQGPILVTLNRRAPEAINSFAFLAGQGFYDGLEFFWVAPGFDAQTGDPTCEASGEFSCTGTGGPGYTLPLEEGADASQAGMWSVIVPATTPGGQEVHGSQFLISLTDAGGFEGSVIGNVVDGRDILESLTERRPCFGFEPSDSNPCQTGDELPPALTIEDVVVRPAGAVEAQPSG